MKDSDFIYIDGIENNPAWNNNLAETLKIIAFKKGITSDCGSGEAKYKIPNMAQAKKIVRERCTKDFDLDISIKQINCLLRPRKRKYPYTAIVIIATIYNLLMEDINNSEWKEEYLKYLETTATGGDYYEEFMLGNMPKLIIAKRDDFELSKAKAIFDCFVASREQIVSMLDQVTIKQCLTEDVVRCISKENIPRIMYDYQSERIYFRSRRK